MAAFFIYMLKSSVCLALLFLCYRLLLSRETFHRFNRLALLSLPFISALLPLVELPVHEVPVQGFALPMVEEAVMPPLPVFRPEEAETAAAAAFPWREGLLLAYLAGVAALLLRLLWAHLRLWQLIRRCTPLRTEADGIRILTHRDAGLSPFSWYRYIVLSEADLQHGARAFLTHERAHIRARHSLDRLVAHVLAAFHWFNPAAWLLLRELKQIHEYEADRRVLSEGMDARSYQLLLIKKAVGTRLYSMANSLNDSSLNKRIIMMKKKKSSPWARAKYLYVLPLAAVSVTALARTEVSNLESELSACNVSHLFPVAKAGDGEKSRKNADEVKSLTLSTHMEHGIDENPNEVFAEFPGGFAELCDFVRTNLKYPIDKVRRLRTGVRAYALFTVEADGSITNAKGENNAIHELNPEIVRLVYSMPKWVPAKKDGRNVRMRLTMPIDIRMRNGEPQVRLNYSPYNSSSDALILIDGKVASKEAYSLISPLDIKSINVLRDNAEMVEKYGDQALFGVIVVTTRWAGHPSKKPREIGVRKTYYRRGDDRFDSKPLGYAEFRADGTISSTDLTDEQIHEYENGIGYAATMNQVDYPVDMNHIVWAAEEDDEK